MKKILTIIIYSIMGLLILSVIVFSLITVKIMPASNFLALLEGGEKMDLPKPISNWRESHKAERDYSTLPPLLTMADGTEVENAVAFETRTKEILELFNDNVYGPIPKKGYSVSFKELENEEIFDGKAIRKQVEITVKTSEGESRALLLLFLPVSLEKVPVFIGLNFKGNHSIMPGESILYSFNSRKYDSSKLYSRGERNFRWPVEEIINQGYGLATMHSDDFAPDNRKTYATRLISLFPEQNLKSITAWSFGLLRGVDYLLTLPEVDPQRIISIGHSRLGKTSLWAGANDTRISMVISNGSGSTGAALSRSTSGETVAAINFLFPYWFTDKYKDFNGKESVLPLDQHMLLASIAPRKLYVSSADRDYWADPDGEFQSFKLAGEAYELFGNPSLPERITPQPGTPIISGNMAYSLRDGQHDILLENWLQFIDFESSFFSASQNTP